MGSRSNNVRRSGLIHVQIAVKNNSNFSLNFWLQDAISSDDLTFTNNHVGKQHTKIWTIDSKLALYGR